MSLKLHGFRRTASSRDGSGSQQSHRYHSCTLTTTSLYVGHLGLASMGTIAYDIDPKPILHCKLAFSYFLISQRVPFFQNPCYTELPKT